MNKRVIFVVFASIFFAGISFGLSKFYVSPKGNDSSLGDTPQTAFATFEKAMSAVVKAPKGDVEVVFAAGDYFVKKGAVLGKRELSGKKLTISAEGGRARLIGGVKVPARELREVKDEVILKKIPADAEGTLFAIDLKKFWISNFGKVEQRGFGTRARVIEMEAFHNLKPMLYAQYPNDSSLIKIGEVLDAGHIRAIAAGQDAYKPKPDPVIRGATFKYIGDRHARWVDAPDAFIRGNLSVGWADDQIQIKKIDTQKGTLELASPHIYGVYSCVPDKNGKLNRADIAVRGYQVYNLLEELDRNGEYYIDRKNGIFYVMFARKPAGDFYFSTLCTPFFTIDGTANLTIKDIDFALCRNTAVKITGTRDSSFSNSEIRVCRNAMEFSGYRNKVENCRIYDCALGGVSLSGGDRKLLHYSRNVIRNCEFFNNARLKMNYSPCLSMHGVAVTAENNEFHDHPHVCLAYTGNEMMIRNNSFIRCCKGSSDMGVTYTGRDQSEMGNVITNNFFSDNLPPRKGAMMCGVYVDDGSGGTKITKNIFCRTGSMGHSPAFGAVYFHAGFDNAVTENVFIECEQGVGQQLWSDERWAAALEREKFRFYTRVDVNSEVYKKKYPKLYRQFDPKTFRTNEVYRNSVFRTPLSLSGNMILRNNRNLLPNESAKIQDINAVKSWTQADVKKFFGDDNLVKNIFRKPIGIIRK